MELFLNQANTEKQNKQLEMQLSECTGKLDDTNRALGDFDAAKKKLAAENSELQRQLEEAESQVAQLNKVKSSLSTQLEEAKRTADEESRVSDPGRFGWVVLIISLFLGTRFYHGQIP